MLTNIWCKNYGRKFGANMDVGGMREGRHSWADYTYQADVCLPHDGGGPNRIRREFGVGVSL